MAIALLWMPLPRDGASDTAQRIALVSQFLAVFGKKQIAYVTADRAFIGKDWIGWLCQGRIPFRIRLRCNDRVCDKNGRIFEAAALFERRIACRKSAFCLWGQVVYLGGKPLPGQDYLVIASSEPTLNLLEDYRHRWKIECLFQALEGRGFQLEDTRVCLPRRLSVLVGLLTLAYLWCVCAGQVVPEEKCCSTGRLRQSVYRRGLNFVHRVAVGLVRQASESEFCFVLQAFTPRKTIVVPFVKTVSGVDLRSIPPRL